MKNEKQIWGTSFRPNVKFKSKEVLKGKNIRPKYTRILWLTAFAAGSYASEAFPENGKEATQILENCQAVSCGEGMARGP